MEQLFEEKTQTEITPCGNKDIRPLFDLYFAAVDYQEKHNYNIWPEFQVEVIEVELDEQRLLKLVDTTTGEIKAVFCYTLSNPDVWQDKVPALYLYRMASNPKFKGQNLLKDILNWAKSYSIENNLKVIRLDTWSDNKSLNNYYIKAGFQKIGEKLIETRTHLADHYQDVNLALLEFKV